MSNETKGPQPPAEAQPCGCGEATCTVPWEPGCGLGKSEQHAEAQAQGGGEVVGPMTEAEVRKWIDACNHEPARQVLRDYLRLRTAPVGVDVGDKDCLTTRARELLADEYRKRGIGTGLVNDAGTATSVAIAAIATALAQKPTAVDEMDELVGLLDEVRSHFTRDDDLPDDLLPRIDAALAAQQGGRSYD